MTLDVVGETLTESLSDAAYLDISFLALSQIWL
jgi:hypothetical protein